MSSCSLLMVFVIEVNGLVHDLDKLKDGASYYKTIFVTEIEM